MRQISKGPADTCVAALCLDPDFCGTLGSVQSTSPRCEVNPSTSGAQMGGTTLLLHGSPWRGARGRGEESDEGMSFVPGDRPPGPWPEGRTDVALTGL